MKKTMMMIAVLVFITANVAKGQAALLILILGDRVASENFYFSIKAGANYSMISGYDEGDARLGFNFGLVTNIRINDRFFLTPEFLPVSPKGVKNVPLLSTGNSDLDLLLVDPASTDRILNYIDIPVLFKWNISKLVSLSAGPQLSILTGATDIYVSAPINETTLTSEMDIKQLANTLDVGGVIDLAFALSTVRNGKGVNIHLRYARGFMDILKEPGTDPFHNAVVQVGASFPFIEE